MNVLLLRIDHIPMRVVINSSDLILIFKLRTRSNAVQLVYIERSNFIDSIKRVGKIDKMQGLSSILSIFRNEFNKCNNT